jgi:hypothetical protein
MVAPARQATAWSVDIDNPADTLDQTDEDKASDGSLPMTDDNNTPIDAIQIDEDVLSYTVVR